MSFLPALAGLLLASAAFLAGFALASGRRSLETVARILAVAGAAALLPSLADPESRPLAAFGVSAALLAPRALPCLMAAAAAAVISLRPPGSPSFVTLALVGPSAALAASSVSTTIQARLAGGADLAWPAAGAGLLATTFLAMADRGRILHWSYGLGGGDARLEIPGAGILLGLALLFLLAGTLMLFVHLLVGSGASLARLAGRRVLLLGGGLLALGAAFAVVRALAAREDALAGGATDVAGLVLTTGLVALSLLVLLGGPPRDDVARLEAGAEFAARLVATFAVLALAAGGFEAWLRAGSYSGSLTPRLAAAALLAVAALPPTHLSLLRRVLALASLVSLLV